MTTLSTALLLLLPLFAGAQTTIGPSPTISLPWNTYTASYATLPKGTPNVYQFTNVRFGETPTGSLRFAAPTTPTTSPVVDPTGAITCHYVKLSKTNGGKEGLGISFPGVPGAGPGTPTKTEDCLFLDVYAPASIFSKGVPIKKVPVIVWFYGGAYVGGSKSGPDDNNPFYTGIGAIAAAQKFNQEVIFVAGNYRLGAFGWLAGHYMEQNGTPNAGLLDQRLILQWVQDNIDQVGGDKSKVSAWGESAGAGSILHHLVLSQEGNQLDPLFSKAILQSPAFEIQWDRSEDGQLDKTYTTFAQMVTHSNDTDIGTLRGLGIDDIALINANYDLVVSSWASTNQIPFGPAVDGSLIRHLPANLFTTGSFWKDLESIMISHVGDEAGIFVPKSITSDDYITTFVSNFAPQPTLSTVRASILSQYPSQSGVPPKMRLNRLIRDSSFTCNTRQLFDAYQPLIPNSTYMLYYNVEWKALGKVYVPANHGTDLLPTFWNADVQFAKFIETAAASFGVKLPIGVPTILAKFFAILAPNYQSYLAAHAVFGDPNKGSFKKHSWPAATTTTTATKITGPTSTTTSIISEVSNVQQVLTNVVQHFKLVVDDINTSGACDFWLDIAAQVDPVGKGDPDETRHQKPVKSDDDEQEKFEL